jgi:Xaa-Pro dipeptidase
MPRNYDRKVGRADTAVQAERRSEVEAKLALIREWLDSKALRAVALTRPGPVAWLTAGITNPIDRSDPLSPLWLVVTTENAVAVTTTVERPRLDAEAKLAEVGFTIEAVPWFDGDAFIGAVEQIAAAPREELGADGDVRFGVDGDDDLTALRLRLLWPERERLVQLGRDAARALERAVSAWRPGEPDRDVQARVAGELERAGALPVCLIVGGDDRVERFRHPLATGQRVERLLMAVVVAMREGLHVAATRFACAGALPASVEDALSGARSVEAAMLAASRPGATYGEVLSACERAYAQVGRPEAWQEHYQGGPVGYRQREFELAPNQRQSRWFGQVIEPGHAVAWNPSLAGGGKSEDTFLVGDAGLLCVTQSGAWPLVEVSDGQPRSAVLDIAR